VGAHEGRVAVVTGAGRGIGRSEALHLAAEGARVVVNDLGVAWDGSASNERPADLVVKEIEAADGTAVANYCDVSDPADANELIEQAVDEFGGLDILVNNAGILRDGMIFTIDPDQWKAVVDVHVLGHFLPTRAAAAYWRDQAKAVGGSPQHRAVICTTSESGLFGNAGQSNYDVAKMGIVSLTISAAKELGKYGVTSNAIAPRARTRLTTSTFDSSSARAGEFQEASGTGFDAMDPGNIAPVVSFLASEEAKTITGQVFIVYGGALARVRLPHVESMIVKEGRWTVAELAERAPELFASIGPDHFEGPRGYAKLPKQR
jgi:NAD(P)-dependent dehydrogenase (short-subunit alcohol dehydrogenase family)